MVKGQAFAAVGVVEAQPDSERGTDSFHSGRHRGDWFNLAD